MEVTTICRDSRIQNSPSLARWDAYQKQNGVFCLLKSIYRIPRTLGRCRPAADTCMRIALAHEVWLTRFGSRGLALEVWLTRFGSRGLAHDSDQIASQHNTQMTCICICAYSAKNTFSLENIDHLFALLEMGRPAAVQNSSSLAR